MKKILKKLLICIIMFLLLFNFYIINKAFANTSVGVAVGWITNIIGGFVSILLWPKKALALAITFGVQALTGSVAIIGGGEYTAVITPYDIFFNRYGITDVNFFDLSGPEGLVLSFRQAVAMWYTIARLIAIAGLLVMLIYVGIRMALSTIASEKATYKSMLVNWATSLALLFVMHYMMLFIININTAIVNALYELGQAQTSTGMGAASVAGVELPFPDFIGRLMLSALSIGINSWASLVLYAFIVFQTISFLILYMKRMLTIGFLVIISPLITITYSMDKMGDQKSQVLDAWMKEFTYNILIQPFHCILYMVFASVAINLVVSDVGSIAANLINPNSLGNCVLAILCLKFVKEGEEIIRKIFGFGKASSLGSVAASTMATAALVSKAGKIAAGAGQSLGKFKNVLGNNKLAKMVKKSKIGQAAGKVTGTISRGINKFTPTRKIRDSIRNNMSSSSAMVASMMTYAGGNSMIQSATAGNMVKTGIDTYMKGSLTTQVTNANDMIGATDNTTETTDERVSRIYNNLSTLTDDKKNNDAIKKMVEQLQSVLKGKLGEENAHTASNLIMQGIRLDLLRDPKNFSMDGINNRIGQTLNQFSEYRDMSDDDKEELRKDATKPAEDYAIRQGDMEIAKGLAVYDNWGGDPSAFINRLDKSKKDRGDSRSSKDASQQQQQPTPAPGPEPNPPSPPPLPNPEADEIRQKFDDKGVSKDGLDRLEELVPVDKISEIKQMLEEQEKNGGETELKRAMEELSALMTAMSQKDGLSETGEASREIVQQEIINNITQSTTVQQITDKTQVLREITTIVETADGDFNPTSDDVQAKLNELKTKLNALPTQMTTSAVPNYQNMCENIVAKAEVSWKAKQGTPSPTP